MYEVKPFTCGGISTQIRIYDVVSDWLCNMTFDTETCEYLDLGAISTNPLVCFLASNKCIFNLVYSSS